MSVRLSVAGTKFDPSPFWLSPFNRSFDSTLGDRGQNFDRTSQKIFKRSNFFFKIFFSEKTICLMVILMMFL